MEAFSSFLYHFRLIAKSNALVFEHSIGIYHRWQEGWMYERSFKP